MKSDIENLIRSIVSMLDDYGFPDDQPANYRNKTSVGNRNLHDWHSEASAAILALRLHRDKPPKANGSASWVKGEAPLKTILLLWNGRALFGPISFQTEEERDQETKRLIATASQIAGAPTHYLIIPKCEL